MAKSWKLLIKPLLFLAALFFFLWHAPITQALAATTTSGAITIKTNPAPAPTGYTYNAEIPVNQVFKITFSVPITSLSDVNTSSIRLLDAASNSVPLSFDVGSDKKSITFAPTDTMLDYDQAYTVSIASGLMANTAYTNTDVDYHFHTASKLYDLITGNTLNELIQKFSPRSLKVFVPKTYITNIDIAATEFTDSNQVSASLTNIDIKAEPEVNSIKISIGSEEIYAVKTGSVWNAGFSGSYTSDDDITFEAFDSYGRSLETRTFKYDPSGVKENYSSLKALSVTKTLADLILNNGKLFNNILANFDTEDLSISRPAQ